MSLYQPIDKIKDKQKREDVESFLKDHFIVKEVLELVAEFKTVLLGNLRTNLRSWIEKAEKYKIPELDSIVKLIRGDLEAVENAIIYNYSNGLNLPYPASRCYVAFLLSLSVLPSTFACLCFPCLVST